MTENKDISNANDGLGPAYGNPPLKETVLSVQFNPLRAFNNAYLGAFWSTHKAKWPGVRHRPLIESHFETFGDEDQWSAPGLALTLTQDQACGIQMINENDDRMIQLQRDRLAYNWRRQGAQAPYPRYPTIRKQFKEAWNDFTQFVGKEKLGDVFPSQWEVVYVNHVGRGELWQSPSQWPALLPPLLGQSSPPLSYMQLEAISGQWVYELTPKRGRLHVDLAPGTSGGESGGQSLILRLTARGPIKFEEPNALQEGLDLGHDAIVESFDRLTSETAHKQWRRQDASNA